MATESGNPPSNCGAKGGSNRNKGHNDIAVLSERVVKQLKYRIGKNGRLTHEDREDILQEVLLRVHEASLTHQIKNPGAFAHRVLRNLIVNHFRKKENSILKEDLDVKIKKKPGLTLTLDDILRKSYALDVANLIHANELVDCVKRLINGGTSGKINEKIKFVVEVATMKCDGYSMKEIAHAFGLNPSALSNRLKLWRQAVCHKIEKECGPLGI